MLTITMAPSKSVFQMQIDAFDSHSLGGLLGRRLPEQYPPQSAQPGTLPRRVPVVMPNVWGRGFAAALTFTGLITPAQRCPHQHGRIWRMKKIT